jgi:hypothetical protein
MKQKITGLLILIVFISMFSVTGCYNDNEARVTIHIVRNDLVGQKPVQKKWFIDRILEFFSTAAYGKWYDNHTDPLTLTISSNSFEDKVYTIPAGATTFSTIIPTGNNITFKITHYYISQSQMNWGGIITTDISPGEQDITIKMIPIIIILYHNCCNYVGWMWDSTPPANATGYYIYRIAMVTPIGESSYTDNDVTLVMDTTYYYKVSIYGSDGEGVLSDPVAVLYNP